MSSHVAGWVEEQAVHQQEYEIDERGHQADSAAASETAGDTTPDVERRRRAQVVEIADAVINFIRTHGSIKSRLASVADPEATSSYLLVTLFKDGPKRAKELAETVCADQSTVSRQVAALVKAGLIERKSDPDDGRASILVPTELGVERVREHFTNRGKAIEPIVADWPAGDREDFLRLLRKYNASLELRRDEVIGLMARSHGIEQVPRAGTVHHSPTVPLQPQPHVRIERSN